MDPDIHELHARQFQPPVIATFDCVDSSTKSAYYSGVLDGRAQATSSPLTPQCSSGSCFFPPYVSLGVCSNCTNVTSELSQQPKTPLDRHNFTFHLLTGVGTDLMLIQNVPWGNPDIALHEHDINTWLSIPLAMTRPSLQVRPSLSRYQVSPLLPKRL